MQTKMSIYLIANNSSKYNIFGITAISHEYALDSFTDVWLKFLDYMNFEVKI